MNLEKNIINIKQENMTYIAYVIIFSHVSRLIKMSKTFSITGTTTINTQLHPQFQWKTPNT